MTAQAVPSANRRGPLRLPTPLLVVAIAVSLAVLLALGTWQVVRQRQAHDLEANFFARTTQPPLGWRADTALPTDEVNYRRVTATGRWDNERSMILANRVRYDLRGEEVVTPLVLAEGGPAILVLRGWYPLEQRETVLSQLNAEATGSVEGLARYVDEPGRVRRTPSGGWSRFDVPAMSRGLPYPVVPWQLIEGNLRDPEAPRPRTLPVREYSAFESMVPHTEYALTWYGLAAALTATAVIRFARRNDPARHDAEASTAGAGAPATRAH